MAVTFAKDRDLAVVEPTVHRDVAWLSQVVSAGSVSGGNGTMLVATVQDTGFFSAGLDGGSVLLVGGAVYEVLLVVSENEIEVSRMRASAADAALALPAIPSAGYTARTFLPQICWAHAQVLAMAGLSAGQEGLVLNAGEAARVEALAALAIIHAAAGALEPAGSASAARAAMYRRRLSEERARVVLEIDRDGDGVAEERRALSTGRLWR